MIQVIHSKLQPNIKKMPSTPDMELADFNYLDSLFKNSKQNTILIMDSDGVVRAVNSAFTAAFGYRPEDIVGRHTELLFTEEDKLRGLPQKELASVNTVGEAVDNNFLVHKDNSISWVSGESLLAVNENGQKSIIKVIQNINTLKISENSIIRLNNFNESILRSIEDVVVVLNRQMDVIKVNAAFCKLFGYTESEALRLNLAGILRSYDKENDLYERLQNVINNKESFGNYSLELETDSGEKKVFDVSCSAMEHGGIDDNILITGHDITTQKQAEKEREDIIGFVAHELRNPLANIVLCNEMMTQLVEDNEVHDLQEYLTRSRNNVMRLNRMISELYDATKFNSGNFTLEKAPFNFEEMIEEALDTIEVLHPDYSIVLEGECPVLVYGDRYRLIQVVTNYLSNGIKYSNNNTKVYINIGQENNDVVVSVRDEGLGISPKQLPHIFGRFFRAERTKNLEGIGLGLYLCRRIVEAHNGKVWAESEEGKGSTFYFSIPV
jgi:PAS domain S-box-containing protein